MLLRADRVFLDEAAYLAISVWTRLAKSEKLSSAAAPLSRFVVIPVMARLQIV